MGKKNSGAKGKGKGKEEEKDAENMFAGLEIEEDVKEEEEEEEIKEEEGEKKKKKKKKKKKNNKALPYHPDSGLEGSAAYYGGLTESQTKALESLKAKIQEEELLIDRSCLLSPAETLDHFLLRFCRARSFDVGAALTMVRNHLKWRKEINLQHLKRMDPEDILGCSEATIFEEIPHWLQVRKRKRKRERKRRIRRKKEKEKKKEKKRREIKIISHSPFPTGSRQTRKASHFQRIRSLSHSQPCSQTHHRRSTLQISCVV